MIHKHFYRMKTRSQTRAENMKMNQIYEVVIDFDGASEAWKSNKKSIGNGSYKYVCQKVGNRGTNCISKCLPGQHYCKTHLKMLQNKKK